MNYLALTMANPYLSKDRNNASPLFKEAEANCDGLPYEICRENFSASSPERYVAPKDDDRIVISLMPMAGIEPACRVASGFKPDVSTDSTTLARLPAGRILA